MSVLINFCYNEKFNGFKWEQSPNNTSAHEQGACVVRYDGALYIVSFIYRNVAAYNDFIMSIDSDHILNVVGYDQLTGFLVLKSPNPELPNILQANDVTPINFDEIESRLCEQTERMVCDGVNLNIIDVNYQVSFYIPFEPVYYRVAATEDQLGKPVYSDGKFVGIFYNRNHVIYPMHLQHMMKYISNGQIYQYPFAMQVESDCTKYGTDLRITKFDGMDMRDGGTIQCNNFNIPVPIITYILLFKEIGDVISYEVTGSNFIPVRKTIKCKPIESCSRMPYLLSHHPDHTHVEIKGLVFTYFSMELFTEYSRRGIHFTNDNIPEFFDKKIDSYPIILIDMASKSAKGKMKNDLGLLPYKKKGEQIIYLLEKIDGRRIKTLADVKNIIPTNETEIVLKHNHNEYRMIL